jgi:hypothetical protein
MLAGNILLEAPPHLIFIKMSVNNPPYISVSLGNFTSLSTEYEVQNAAEKVCALAAVTGVCLLAALQL